MDAMEAMRRRCSVRAFLPTTIETGKIKMLEQAALLAPTSLNLQQQRFYFIMDAGLISRMASGIIEESRQRGENDYLQRLAQRGGKVFFGAPLVVVIAVNGSNNYVDVDAGIAVQNIAIAATAAGLGSVIMAAPDRIFTGRDDAGFNEVLGFPEGYRFAIAIAVGYQEHDFHPHDLKPENIVVI